MTTQILNAQMLEILKGTFVPRRDPVLAWSRAISQMMLLPGLRALYGMGSVDESGNVYDHSGQGRTLSNVSTLAFGVYNTLVPYAIHDGSADCLRRADEAGLDITGVLTCGGWFYATDATPGADMGLFTKWSTLGQRAYALKLLTTGLVQGLVSSNGTLETTVSSAAVSTATWFHVALRYTPSTELSLWVNGVETVNTTSIPASIFSSSAALEIGAFNAGSSVLDGRSTLGFLCAAALGDTTITTLYQSQRAVFSH